MSLGLDPFSSFAAIRQSTSMMIGADKNALQSLLTGGLNSIQNGQNAQGAQGAQAAQGAQGAQAANPFDQSAFLRDAFNLLSQILGQGAKNAPQAGQIPEPNLTAKAAGGCGGAQQPGQTAPAQQAGQAGQAANPAQQANPLGGADQAQQAGQAANPAEALQKNPQIMQQLLAAIAQFLKAMGINSPELDKLLQQSGAQGAQGAQGAADAGKGAQVAPQAAAPQAAAAATPQATPQAGQANPFGAQQQGQQGQNPLADLLNLFGGQGGPLGMLSQVFKGLNDVIGQQLSLQSALLQAQPNPAKAVTPTAQA